jgi:hypothetical protein
VLPITESINVWNNDSNNVCTLKRFENFFDSKSQQLFFNLGFPISCLDWAPRSKGPQFLAIGFSTKKNHFNDEKINKTIFSLNLDYLNLINDDYCADPSFVLICTVDIEDQKDIKFRICK